MLLPYERRKRWKITLIISALIIAIGSLIYTNKLVQELMEEEEKFVTIWASAYTQLSDDSGDDFGGDITFLFEIIKKNDRIPLILVDEEDKIISSRNFDSTRAYREGYLEKELEEMKKERPPITIRYGNENKNYIYYKDSQLVKELRYFPYVQLFVISLFFMVAFMALNASKKFEQNRVWVGMAKETAHQLGTPLTSLIAWVEYLKMNEGKIEEEFIGEMEKDINRLEKVADRFSKVGAVPELKAANVYEVVYTTMNYFRTRVSKQISIEITADSDKDCYAKISRTLFEWVIENLIKNAVDAISRDKGHISIHLYQNPKNIIIEVEDSGKGIPKQHFKTIFNPGYTTRKRGWGLGLTLTKRIIDEYHNGHISVSKSEVGVGTTFQISLPNAKSE